MAYSIKELEEAFDWECTDEDVDMSLRCLELHCWIEGHADRLLDLYISNKPSTSKEFYNILREHVDGYEDRDFEINLDKSIEGQSILTAISMAYKNNEQEKFFNDLRDACVACKQSEFILQSLSVML